MKKLFIALGALLIVLVGAILMLPTLVPADRIKNEVVAQVKAATGRDLAIDGKVSVSVFPSLSVEVSNVALSNLPGYSVKDMVRLGALEVKLKLLPILSGTVAVDSFVLIDPVVTLETDKKGRPNWQFSSGETPKPEAKAEPKPKEASSGGGPADIRLGEIAIRNGKLVYLDGQAGTREEVSDLNLAVTLKSLDDPLAVRGGLKWRGQAIDLTLNAARPRALVDGKSTPADLSIATPPVKLAFKGEVSGAGEAAGDLDLGIPSVRELVKWATGKPLDLPGTGLGPFDLKGKLAAAPTRVALSQAAIRLDAIKAEGEVAVDTAAARPSLKGRLAVDRLDLNPYLPPEDKQPAKPAAEAKSKAAGAKSDWSDEPIDTSGLKAADVDLALSAGGIRIRAIDIGKSALHLTLSGGRLAADLTELALYQGAGKGRLALDGSQPGLGLDAHFSLKGLQAEPFLAAAAGFDRLEGTGDADIQVAGRGRSERQIVQSLDGKGAVSFTDGAIRGINLAAMVRNVTSAFSEPAGSQKTDFAELSGSFVITDGLVTNKDLALKSPLLRVDGAGTVDLPKRTVHYRVDPKAVASLEGQGGAGDLAGIMIPVIIEGPWDNLSYRPDLTAAAKGQALEAVQGALGGKGPAGLLPGLGGSQQQKPQQQTQPQTQPKTGSPLPLPGGLFGR
ncbi:MAG: AsmA family protein [Solirubrobacterales bacterium]